MKHYIVDKASSSVCENCPRYRARVVQSQPSASQHVKMMVVGEGPAVVEDRTGKPFQGLSGKLLNKVCHLLHIDRSELYITNALRCYDPVRPVDTDKKALEQCRKHLHKEIDLVRPRLVLTLGNPALFQIQNRRGVLSVRGQRVHVNIKERSYATVPTIHPAHVLRNPAQEPLLVADVRLAWRYACDPDWKPHPVTYRYVRTLDQFREMMRELQAASAIACDTESSGYNPLKNTYPTDGLDYLKGHLLCIQFSTAPRTAWVLPFVGQFSVALWTFDELRYILKRLHMLFSRDDVVWFGHNFKHDQRHLSRLGKNLARIRAFTDEASITVSPYQVFKRYDPDVTRMKVVDTMQQAILIDENATKGLKDIAALYTDLGAYEADVTDLVKKLKVARSVQKVPITHSKQRKAV